MTLDEVLTRHRIVVCVGSGGVGKTTTSAALALEAARRGERVLCMTVDPARRLASSLGLGEMTTELRRVPPERLVALDPPCRGELWVTMLDTKQTFDRLVFRYAPNADVRERILSNRIYRYVSTSLAGTQEYMAMERLHEVRSDPRWDRLVLDTPPATHAMDFLDAPGRLVDAIDSAAMRWFVQAFQATSRLSFGMFGKSAAMLLKGLSRFTGGAFLEQVADFVTGLNALFGGFRHRAAEVAEGLRSDEVAFLAVTTPRPFTARETLRLLQGLRVRGIRPRGLVVNGVHPSFPEPSAHGPALREAWLHLLRRTGVSPPPLAGSPASASSANDWLDALERTWREERMLAESDAREVARLQGALGDEETRCLVRVPALSEDVHDLSALAIVSDHLFGRRSLTQEIST